MSESLYAGLTSQTIDVFLGDSSSTTGGGLAGLAYNSAGLTCYSRKGATGSATAITLATQTVGGAWSSGGFVQIDSTNMPGVYRFDVPNAVIDAEGYATVYFRGATNLVPTAIRIDCRALPSDVKKLLGTAWLTPAVAGTPDVNAKQVSGDTTAADTLELFAEALDQATGQIDSGTLADNTITAASIAASAIGSSELADGAITAAKIATDAIDADALAADAVTEIQSGLATAANLATVAGYLDTEVAAILADTNELQTDWANGGRLDVILDARSSQTSVDDLPTNAELATALGTADDAVLAAIAALNNLSAAQVTAAVPTVSQIWTTALTESYRSVGAAGTAAQLLHELIAHMGNSAISGTTKTINNRAGSAAKTYTLDSSTAPTSIAEAT